jgi:hypothetical protein
MLSFSVRSLLLRIDVALLGVAFTCLLPCQRSTAVESATAIQRMGVSEVLAELDKPADQLEEPDRREQLTKQAAALLLEDALWDRGEFASIRRLAAVAAPAFSGMGSDQRERLEAMLADVSVEDAASFEELQARVALLNAAGKHDETATPAVEKWLSSRDLSSLEVDQVAWCLAEYLSNRPDVTKVSVVWTGTITSPRSGEYEFSTTPIDVNRQGADFVRHSIVANVGDVEVLHTPQASVVDQDETASRRQPAPKWQPTGAKIKLQANQPTPVRIEMQYEAAQPAEAFAAILCWKGPGLERQAISPKVLASPNGQPGGLHAEYRWSERGREQTASQDGAVVDVVWMTPATVAPRNPELVKRLSDRLWTLSASEEHLQEFIDGRAALVYAQEPAIAGLLGSARRQEFVERLVAHPELLDKADDDQLLALYRNLRFGAEEASIDLLGDWMQQHADVQPEIVADFFEENRRVYWELGKLLARQPESLDRLQDDYLVMDDGRCALPAAYTLSYGNLAADRMAPPSLDELENPAAARNSRYQKWRELLASRSNAKDAPDSVRINWALARAQAAEVSSGAPPRENYQAGMDHLHASQQLPNNELEYVRVHLEEIARLIAMGRQAQVDELIQRAEAGIEDDVIASWRVRSAAVLKHYADQRKAEARLTRSAYFDVLRRRREHAVAKNDVASVARYDAMLGDSVETSQQQ